MKESETTWQTLTEAEPRLIDLYNAVAAIKDDGTEPAFCANDWWYGDNGFKDRMSDLVGWGADEDNPQYAWLTTGEVYDLAYSTLYDLLPPCRNCGCLGIRATER